MPNCVDFGRHSFLFAAQPRADHPLATQISGRGTVCRQFRPDNTLRWHRNRDPPSFARCCALPAQEDTDLHEASSSVDASLGTGDSASWLEEPESQPRSDGGLAGRCEEPYSGRDFEIFPPGTFFCKTGTPFSTPFANKAPSTLQFALKLPPCKLP